ncbi:MAG: dihydropteroate synthase [Bacteroidales bacterium]
MSETTPRPQRPFLIRAGGQLLSLERPMVMGIINVTPDSFYDGGRYETREMVRLRAERMLTDGAAILDIGACSTRPGSPGIDAESEKMRLEPALSAIRESYPEAVISVDTYRASVAAWAVEEFGVQMINDVSGGRLDTEMFSTIGRLKVPYVLMHMLGTPGTMQMNPTYHDVAGDLSVFFYEKISELRACGVDDILIDPGFGFGKTIEHNYELIARLGELRMFDLPLVVGVSRKSMIYRVLDSSPESALNGTTVIHTVALLNGANILRVHDVKQAVECIDLVEKIKEGYGFSL